MKIIGYTSGLPPLSLVRSYIFIFLLPACLYISLIFQHLSLSLSLFFFFFFFFFYLHRSIDHFPPTHISLLPSTYVHPPPLTSGDIV
ncbi:hypothetical protein QVD17_04426 [Tagetes erecta]|uniref:Uncharacterized protein n=1 Tax=Tagetes erecta TaxID=13708 RepID=A0AAD8PAQ3_TARER|nr:hypothetical protein QVD17_04426 [Tagetes erecta]